MPKVPPDFFSDQHFSDSCEPMDHAQALGEAPSASAGLRQSRDHAALTSGRGANVVDP